MILSVRKQQLQIFWMRSFRRSLSAARLQGITQGHGHLSALEKKTHFTKTIHFILI